MLTVDMRAQECLALKKNKTETCSLPHTTFKSQCNGLFLCVNIIYLLRLFCVNSLAGTNAWLDVIAVRQMSSRKLLHGPDLLD